MAARKTSTTKSSTKAADPKVVKPTKTTKTAALSSAPRKRSTTDKTRLPGGRPSKLEGLFESREKEPFGFEVLGIRPTRVFATGKLLWEVPPDKVELFRAHFHVQSNRIQYLGRKDRTPAEKPDETAPADAEVDTPIAAEDDEEAARISS